MALSPVDLMAFKIALQGRVQRPIQGKFPVLRQLPQTTGFPGRLQRPQQGRFPAQNIFQPPPTAGFPGGVIPELLQQQEGVRPSPEFGELARQPVVSKPSEKKEIKLFRGETQGIGQEGRYFSTNKEWARQFTQTGRISEVKSITIPRKHILDLRKFGEKLPSAVNEEEIDRARELAETRGFKAFFVDEGGKEPMSVFFLKLKKKSHYDTRKP